MKTVDFNKLLSGAMVTQILKWEIELQTEGSAEFGARSSYSAIRSK